jgi:predicted transcriptional regulator
MWVKPGRFFKYRSRAELTYHILVETMHRATLSWISLHVGINRDVARRYISRLIERGLIMQHIEEKGLTYETTEKGRTFVEFYLSIREIFPI